jgi:hypothetical protein
VPVVPPVAVVPPAPVLPPLPVVPPVLVTPPEPVEPPLAVVPPAPVEPPDAVVPPEPVVEPTTTHLLMSSAQARPGLQALPAMHEHSSSPGVQFDAPPLPPPLPPVPVLGWPHDTATSPQAATVKTEILKKLEAIVMVRAAVWQRPGTTATPGNDPPENDDQAAVGAGAFVVSVRKSYFRDFQIVPSR